MADKKISQLTALSAANLAPSTDVLAIVDTSATETKKIVAQDLINGVLNVASAVGIGTASPTSKLDLVGIMQWQATAGTVLGKLTYSGGEPVVLANTGLGLQFFTNNAFAAKIDTSGVLLVGNTTNYGVGSAENNSLQAKGPIVLAANNTGSANNRNWIFQTNAAAAGSFSLAYSSTNTGWPNAAYALVVDSSGNLGVGTTTPDIFGRFYTRSVGFSSSGTTALQINGTTYGTIDLGANGTRILSVTGASTEATISAVANVPLRFETNSAERGRFSAVGYFKASDAGTYVNSTGTYHELRNTANETACLMSCSNTGFTSSVLALTAYPVSGTGFKHLICRSDNGNDEVMNIRGDGNLYNDNGVYGSISDARLKQDIVDAPSQWDDLKAVRFRKYRFKADVEKDSNAPALFGVVAQELEQVCPGLVDDGEIKTVKSSILLMKAAKALQEAMARIESLEAKVSALEAK